MFAPNDRVVHPMHGAGVIEDITEQRVNGETKLYYGLRVPTSSVRLLIPVVGSEHTGIRTLVSREEALDFLEKFSSLETYDAPNWNKRYRDNMTKLRSGRIEDVASVFKSLLTREKERGLSTGEHKMLNTARQILLSELSWVLERPADDIERELRDRI